MTDNARRIFQYLKENYGAKLTNADIATALGVSSPAVVGSVNSLVKKGYAERTDATIVGAEDKPVKVRYISLTEAGYDFDPDAVVEKAE